HDAVGQRLQVGRQLAVRPRVELGPDLAVAGLQLIGQRDPVGLEDVEPGAGLDLALLGLEALAHAVEVGLAGLAHVEREEPELHEGVQHARGRLARQRRDAEHLPQAEARLLHDLDELALRGREPHVLQDRDRPGLEAEVRVQPRLLFILNIFAAELRECMFISLF
ncbi:MAG: hypothetical protein ACK559_09670, partial [bacterium]